MNFFKSPTTYLSLLFLFSLSIFQSCGLSDQEKVNDGILSANISLETRDCDSAISTLENLGRQNKNGRYLVTLASAYACKASYSSTVFYTNDLPLFGGTSKILGGMAKFQNSSTMDSPSNTDFSNLQKAIDILLYAGGLSTSANPSSAQRIAALGSEAGGDVNALLMYMVMTQIGKYLYYYGNSDSTGTKGAGAQSNSCISDYDGTVNVTYDDKGTPVTSTLANAIIALNSSSAIGSCANDNSGHTQLQLGSSTLKARLCQGVVLMNNLIDILPSVIASLVGVDATGSAFETVASNINLISQALSVVTSPDMTIVKDVKAQAVCESDVSLSELYVYYVFVYEILF